MAKTVENKQTKLPLSEDKFAKYSDLLFIAVNKPIPEGINLSEMRKGLKVIGTLTDAKDADVIVFDDEDFESIIKDVQSARWAAVSKELIDFEDYLLSLR